MISPLSRNAASVEHCVDVYRWGLDFLENPSKLPKD